MVVGKAGSTRPVSSLVQTGLTFILTKMKRYDEDYDDYDEYGDPGSNLDDSDDLDDFLDEEEDTTGPVTDEGALYFDMIQKLYATLDEYGQNDPVLLQLQASLTKITGANEDTDENMYYMEEAIGVAQHIKKYTKDSPNVKLLYENLMKDIVRFTDESAPGHQGDYYL